MSTLKGNSYFLCIVYFFLMLVPMEAFFFIGDIRMEAYRLFLIIIAPWVLINLHTRQLIGGTEKVLLVFCFWVALSFVNNHGLSKIESGVINFLEVFVGYGLGLLLLGCRESLRKILKIVCISFIVLAPFAIVEAQNGLRILHIYAAELFNNPVVEYLGDSYFRHGLHRASTVFSHPILYSICALMLLPLVFWFYQKSRGFMFASGLIVAMVTSVTSAGILMVIMQIGLLVLNKITQFFQSIYKVVIWSFALVYIFLIFASNRGPILVMVETLALNASTAYARYQQWQFAADDIAANPLFGKGFGEWTRPFWMSSSVDSYWLNITLENGYPALLAVAIFFLISMKNHWQLHVKSKDCLFHFAIFASISSVAFAALTVDFFDRAQLMIFFMMGAYNSFYQASNIEENLRKEDVSD